MHVVVGAGSVGTRVAHLLVSVGADVCVVSRSGTSVPGAAAVRADAADLRSLLAVSPEAVAIYNCANPRYHEWARDWPPMSEALLAYAEQTGAVLATCSNLYGYGPVDGPMRESLPLCATGPKGRIRAGMWAEAKSRHDAGRIRATEVRGSDYIAATEASRVGSARVVPRILAGRSVSLIGGLDTPHTWTAPADVARALVTCAADERAWGRAWHAPSNPPRTQREVIDDLALAAGVPPVKVSQVPQLALRVLGLVNPVMREFRETEYQFDRPYVMDDSAIRSTFGLEPTAWDVLLRQTVQYYRHLI